jgi:apoptogenic protein 1
MGPKCTYICGREEPGLLVLSTAPAAMSKRAFNRFLHITARTKSGIKSVLVGPPHPVSNIRPVLYDGQLPDRTATNAYSAREVQPPRDAASDPTKFQLDLTLQRLDRFNHNFWLDVRFFFQRFRLVVFTPSVHRLQSNTRFHVAQEKFLQKLRPRLDLAKTPEERGRMEEEHLTQFYRQWSSNERAVQQQYTREWTRAQYSSIWFAAKMTWRSWVARIIGA